MANEYTSSAGQSSMGADDLKARAQDTVSRVQERAGEQIQTRIQQSKQRAADTLSDVAESLLSSSQTLRDHGNEGVSRYMEKAADQFDRLASYLDRADVHEMLDEVEDFARRQPAAFIGGAVAVGFLASRFLKSSRSAGPTGRISDTGRALDRDFATPRTVHYGRTAPMSEDWRRTGYAASEVRTGRDVVGDPSVRTSVGLETDSDRDRGV